MNNLRGRLRMRDLSRARPSRRAFRQAGIAGACVLAAGVAAACSSSSSTGSAAASSGPVTVPYWTSGSTAETNWIDTNFDKAHPGIKAVGQYVASADQSTAKQVAALQSG